jgi:type I restriction enzyme R subunit
MTSLSNNFAFLAPRDAQLVKLGALAERYFTEDHNTCLMKLRQFGEALAQLTAAQTGRYTAPGESQFMLLQRLTLERVLPPEVVGLFHQLCLTGNQATHAHADDHAEALSTLKDVHIAEATQCFHPRSV